MRIATANFILTFPNGQHHYKQGEAIKPEHAEHWYAQAHSAEVPKEETPAPVEEAAPEEQPEAAAEPAPKAKGKAAKE